MAGWGVSFAMGASTVWGGQGGLGPSLLPRGVP